MADALASGASVRKNVGVQVPPRAQSAVLELQAPEVTNSKEGVTSGFSCFPGEVEVDCVGGDLWGRVLACLEADETLITGLRFEVCVLRSGKNCHIGKNDELNHYPI